MNHKWREIDLDWPIDRTSAPKIHFILIALNDLPSGSSEWWVYMGSKTNRAISSSYQAIAVHGVKCGTD
jgi:hypothetical protein